MTLCRTMLVGLAAALAIAPLAPSAPLGQARGTDDLPRIAVLNLDTRESQSESDSIAEELRAAFVKSGQYTVVDRTLTSRITKEWETQQSGLTDTDRALKVGKLYNVQYIVTGKLSKLDVAAWQVSGVMLDAQSGIALRAETVRHRGDFFSLLDQRVPALARALLGRGPSEALAKPVAAAVVIPIAPGFNLAGEWSGVAPLKPGRQDHVAVTVNNRIFVIGGQDSNGPTTTVAAFDPASGTWSQLPGRLPTARRFPAAAVLDGRIYVIGGMVNDQASNAVEALDPATGIWQQLAPMPTKRWQAGAAEVGGTIYVVGGRTGKNDLSDTVEAYDPRANTWKAKGPAPNKRAAVAMAAIGGLIYVTGGESKDLGVSFLSVKSGDETLTEYDPAGDRWAVKRQAPTGRTGPAAVVVGSRIYVFGGLVGSSLMRSPARHYDVYDQSTDKWTQHQAMPRGRANHAAAAAGGRIYVIGGSGDASTMVDEMR